MIQEALAEARTELAALHTRQIELEEQIAQAEAALSDPTGPSSHPETMTLHAAVAHVLRENNNEWMTVRDITDAVNQRGLYHRRDRSPVEINQVHARTNNYRAIFEKDGANIRLREESPVLTTHSRNITVFRDDDAGYFRWLDDNPGGHFINCERNPKPSYLVLHHASCSHIDRSPSLHWTKDYVKLCSPSRPDLEEWAVESAGGEVTLCSSCFGG